MEHKTLHGRILKILQGSGPYSNILVLQDGNIHHYNKCICDKDIAEGQLVEIDDKTSDETIHITPVENMIVNFNIDSDVFRWNNPDTTVTRAQILRLRHQIIKEIRSYFDEQGFLETQVPHIIRGTCPDPYIDSFAVEDRYLTTSTEYQIKRLIAGGFDKVYTLCQNFRHGEISDRHNPEFTMLEWGRAYSTLNDIETDAENLIRRICKRIFNDKQEFIWNDVRIDIDSRPWIKISIKDALLKYCSINIGEHLDIKSLKSEVLRLGWSIPDYCIENSHAFVSLVLDMLQKRILSETPVFLCDWPSFMTSSAPLKNGQSEITERSELIIAGLELSDGFPWHTSADKQREGFQNALKLRKELKKEAVKIDEKYIGALSDGMPPGAGMALGIDRLVMILTGASNIKDVLAFSWDEV